MDGTYTEMASLRRDAICDPIAPARPVPRDSRGEPPDGPAAASLAAGLFLLIINATRAALALHVAHSGVVRYPVFVALREAYTGSCPTSPGECRSGSLGSDPLFTSAKSGGL
jgi:hypothetical protein